MNVSFWPLDDREMMINQAVSVRGNNDEHMPRHVPRLAESLATILGLASTNEGGFHQTKRMIGNTFLENVYITLEHHHAIHGKTHHKIVEMAMFNSSL